MPDRLEWDTYLPRHPAYISLLEPPQQQIATDWKAEDHSTGNYIIEILHMIPASHPPVARPLALRSAFNRAPPSFWRLRGDSGNGSDYDSPFRRFRQRARQLIAPGPTSQSKTTPPSKRIRGRGHLEGLERHHG